MLKFNLDRTLMILERWVDIPNYERIYQASSAGRIRSFHGKTPRILKAHKNGSGYLNVGLCENGKRTVFYVHRLVAIAFHGEPNGKEVNHKNLDKSDNSIDNLEFVTHQQNQQHASQHGRFGGLKPNAGARGAAHYRTSLTESDVKAIRSESIKGVPLSDLASAYSCTYNSIHAIVTRRNWKHLA